MTFSKKSLIAAGLSACLIILFFSLRLMNRLAPEAPKNAKNIKPIQLEKLQRLRQNAQAYLENQLPDDALPILELMKSEFPSEAKFADENLAVGLTLQLEILNAEGNPEAFAEQINTAVLQLESVINDDETAAIPHLLLSRVEKIRGRDAAQIAAATAAVQRDNLNPAFWFELFQAYRNSNQEDGEQESLEAIKRVVELRPDNLWALLHFMELQSLQQEKELLATLNRLKRLISPIAAGIEQRSRLNPLVLIEESIAGMEAGNWQLVSRNVRLLGNILRPEEISQSDRTQLMPNTLEFLRERFSQATETLLSQQMLSISDPIDVRFTGIKINELDISSPIRDVDIVDLDLDGDYEIAVLTERKIIILHREKVQETFEKFAIIEIPEGFESFIFADLDQDANANLTAAIEGAPCALADLDLIIYGTAGIEIYENQLGNPTENLPRDKPFRRVEFTTDFSVAETSVQNVTVADFDLDGDLDLISIDASGQLNMLANYRDFQFVDISERSSLPSTNFQPAKIVPVDIDRDVDLDLVVQGQNGVGYLENLRHGALRWVPITFPANAADSNSQVTDLAVVDLDLNATWDLLVAVNQKIIYLPSRITPSGTVKWAEPITLPELSAEYFRLIDYDNDGYQDLMVGHSNEETLSLYRRSGRTSFSPSHAKLSGKINPLRSSADGNSLFNQHPVIEDLDRDGDLDVITWQDSTLYWERNEGGNQNSYLQLVLHGQQVKGDQASASGRVNHYGWGSLMELKAGELYQPRIVDRQIMHFGLGPANNADVVRVLWPNGIPQNVIHPKNNLFICEEQRLKGSCPYLYAWNGSQFDFVTDLLWAAPVGLQFAEGVIAPTRAWEYLLIEGEQLRPNKQNYEIRITEELWETAYFDQVRLLAIDHPEEIDVFSNEKVGSSTPPDFHIHTAIKPILPQSIIDHRGRNLLPDLKDRDEIYARPFQEKYYQGVTEPWFIELNLGKLKEPSEIKLFLTGWVFPSDTSINVALAQSKSAPSGRPPYLQVPDEKGEWKTIDDRCGFPGGKTKTIVIDLSGRFLSDDYRVRIGASMELYWDHLFFTVNETDIVLTTQELVMESALLRPRGISASVPHPQYGPEKYDYYDVNTSPAWPPMRGKFTNYGNVLDLLSEADDRLVSMPAGDEIAIRFSMPDKPLPSGWSRDFILHNVGYDKDADLNTIYGQSSEPLPTRKTATYPAVPQVTDSFLSRNKRQVDETDSGRTQKLRSFWTLIRDY